MTFSTQPYVRLDVTVAPTTLATWKRAQRLAPLQMHWVAILAVKPVSNGNVRVSIAVEPRIYDHCSSHNGPQLVGSNIAALLNAEAASIHRHYRHSRTAGRGAP